MSQLDERQVDLPEADSRQQDNDKLVPVSESIRYRKRAQSAEKRLEVLEDELAKVKSEAVSLGEQLNCYQERHKLSSKLSVAGAVDVEAAVLIAESRINGDADADIDEIVEQLKMEKGYLFGGSFSNSNIVNSRKTASAKDKGLNTVSSSLERLAKKAAKSGNRVDLTEYLKMRRSMI